MKAILALENGSWYEGEAAGAAGETGGEVVFNTSLTGYQEILTDPSYSGQIVTMTCPGDRQLRHRAGRRGVAGAAGGRLHRPRRIARCQQLAIRQHAARLSRAPQRRRDLGHRHARADARAAVGRRHARRHCDRRRRSARARRKGARPRADGRIRSRSRRHLRRAVRLEARALRRVHAVGGAAAAASAARRAPTTSA